MVLAPILFLLTALGGGVLLVVRLVRGRIPFALAALHGFLALLALTTFAAAFGEGATTRALVLTAAAFGAAVLVGFYLVSVHLSGRPVPLVGIGIHAVLSATGIGLLLASSGCFANRPSVGGAAAAPRSWTNNRWLPGPVVRLQVRLGLGAMPAFPSERIPAEDLDAIVEYLAAMRDS